MKRAASSNSLPRRRGTTRFAVLWGAFALALAGGLALYLRALERDVIRQTLVNETVAAANPRPVAEVAAAVRALKLVTVEISTKVGVTSADTHWRGDASASVEVPVKLLYGCDLSEMKVDAIAVSPATGIYVVRVPKPQRIASEIFGSDEKAEVQVGWARLRSRAGEFHLGQARKQLSDQARQMVLSDEDARKVADATREQVATLVRSIVGEKALVDVRFDEGEKP